MDINQPKILIVEDVEIAQKTALYIFSRLNCAAVLAKTGYEALDMANQEKFDLIFMDLGLPDTDGTTVAETIRQSSLANQTTPIVALTAHSPDPILVEDCAKAGMNDFITKPLLTHTAQLMLSKFVKPGRRSDFDEAILKNSDFIRSITTG